MNSSNRERIPSRTDTACAGTPRLARFLHLGVWSLVVLIGHAWFLNSGFTNLEFAFAGAARHFSGVVGDGQEMERYFAHQANPLGYSLVAAIGFSIVGHGTSFWSVRIPSLAGALLILVAGWLWCANDAQRRRVFPVWSAAIATNPLVWCYSGQATADILPTGLVMFAFSLCVTAKLRFPPHIVAATLVALACLVKYNAILLLPMFLSTVLLESRDSLFSRRNLAILAVYSGLTLAILGIYGTWLYGTFGIFMVPEHFRRVYQQSTASNSHVNVFLCYLAYLAMVCGFFSAILPIANGRRIVAGLKALPQAVRSGKLPHLVGDRTVQHGTATIAATSCLLIGLYGMLNVTDGEMNQGGFDHLFPSYLFTIAKSFGLFLAIYAAVIWAFHAWRTRKPFSTATLIGIAVYLVASSLTRPAQRYLLLILPLVMWQIVVICSRVRSPWKMLAQVTGIGLFGALSLVGSTYLASQGDAADRLARWIVRENLATVTAPGAISFHAGQYFPASIPNNPRYVVITGESPQALRAESMWFAGQRFRTYSLVPTRSLEATPRHDH